MRRYLRQVPVTLVMAVALAAVARESRAQARPEPKTVEEVVRRYVDAIGGEAALRSITSRHVAAVTRVRVADTLPELESKSDHYFMAPDKYLMRIGMPMGQGTIDMGVNGRVGWTSNAFTGVQRLDSAGAAALLRSGRIPRLYTAARDVTLAGRTTLDGRPAIAIRYHADTSVATMTDYYDLESGLMLGTDAEPPAGGGPGMQLRYDDYRWMGRERIAMTTRMLAQGKAIATVTVTAVDHVPLDAALFTPPATLPKSP